MCETITDSSDLSQCTSRFSHVVKIRSTPEALVKRQPRARRLFGMTSEPLCGAEIASPSVDKENDSDLSSPTTHMPTSQKIMATKPATVLRYPLEDCGRNSQDSSYGNNIVESTQMISNGIIDLLPGHIVSPSEEPMECDEWNALECDAKPTALRGLFSLKTSKNENCKTSPMSKVKWCLVLPPKVSFPGSKLIFEEGHQGSFSAVNSPRANTCKRPEPPMNGSPVLVKKSSTSCSLQEIPEVNVANQKPTLQRRCSETEAHARIESAIHRSTTDADLIGDFSKRCILPLTEGRHADLKSISSETLAGLILGDFEDSIRSFTIIDCRYPYEYDGGHILGAVNLYSKDLIEQSLLNPITQTPEIQLNTDKRMILVFHCEFSWERGPNLTRFLRNVDRQRNKEHYPALYYPEVYLLHGGYQEFFRTQKTLCLPQEYKPMKHPDHEAELRQFRSKSKNWQGGRVRRNGLPARTNFKRLCF